MRILPRLPLYCAAVASATACGLLLTAAPAFADFDITGMPEDDQVPCERASGDTAGLSAKSWTIDFIGINEAHQYNRGSFDNGDPVTIAVIDSGVQADLPVFGDRVQDGFDPWDPPQKGQCDGFGHGTGVAAIAAGAKDGEQFVGVAPEAEIIPLRLFQGGPEEGGDQNKSKLIGEAIRAAVDNGSDVINISIVAVPTPELESAVEYATQNNTVIVAATGNEKKHMDSEDIEPKEQTYYPANYPEVIAVGAHNPSGNWYEETNFGDNLDLLAPGEGVTAPYPNGEGYVPVNGTSYAAPHVAGAAALLKGHFGKDKSPDWIERRLKATAIHPPNDFNIYQGHGVVNLPNALTAPEESMDEEPADDDESSEAPPPADPPSLDAVQVRYDPLATEKTVAWGSVIGAIALITIVIVLKKLIPKGRSRGWRAGTRDQDTNAVATSDTDTL